jgi:hypothetical protein
MQPKRYYQQLKGISGGDVQTIDVTSGNLTASFSLGNLIAKVGREWAYATKIRLLIRTQIDQPAMSGVALNADQLYRVLSSIQLKSDDLGTIYGPGDLSGPALGLIAQVISNRYAFPFQLRAQIAAADGDTAVVIPIEIPIAHMCFMKGHQTGIWNGWLRNGGELQVNLAASTWPAVVSTGAAAEATTDVRATLVYTLEPEARPPVIWHWRTRDTAASETKHTIRNMNQGSGIKGATGAGKLAFLAWLSDQNGLGGADGVDEIRRVYPRDRGQDSHNIGAPFYGASDYLYDFVSETRSHNIYPPDLGAGYPFAQGTAVNGSPNVATALYLPYFWPDPQGQEVSKCQEWSGEYYVEHEYGTVPTIVSKWLSLEQSYMNPEQEAYLMDRMGLPPSRGFISVPKVKTMKAARTQEDFAAQQQKLRGVPKKISAR